VAIVSFAVYLIGIYRGKTKPHAFTWFAWGAINAVALAAVLSAGGGLGSWVLAVNTVACFIVAFIGFYQKKVQYDFYDWIALAGALIGAALWGTTGNPLYGVILVSISDAIAIIPSVRKAYRLPFEENVSSFIIGISYYLLALPALQSFTLTTSLYHFEVIAVDLVLILTVLIRRSAKK